MRTRRNRGAVWPLAVATAFAGALALSLVQPSEAAAQNECGEYISGGPNYPASGNLVSFQMATISIAVGYGVSFRIRVTVGRYDMHDGSIIYVPCHFQ